MNENQTIDLQIRIPLPAEMERVAHLFRRVTLRREARLLVALRSHPVERFVAAAAWWPERTVARFQVVCQPGVARAPLGEALLGQLSADACAAGMESLQNAELLKEDDEWFGILRGQGFERLRSERSFEVASRDVWDRVTRLYQKHQKRIPGSWRTDPIRQHPPETVLELVAPHCLMPPDEICSSWCATSRTSFDLDLSCVLFDRERPFGTLLARRLGDLFYVHVQVVREGNPRLRSLADLCLLYHAVQRVSREGPIQRVQFRSGETEHRQTANLALRMGGRELSRAHVLSRKVII